MPGADKKEGKKTTKLSLTKKSQRSRVSSDTRNEAVKTVLPGKVDLNETCEFQQPLKFSGCGDSKVKAENDKKTQPAATKASKSSVNIVEDESVDENVVCQVCNKNLGHMTTQHRHQHVNRCIDKVEVLEKQKRDEHLMLASARTAVLNCPMCGKHFKSENARVVHLKKCCQSVGVSTEKMLQLVKVQEQERCNQLAAGIVPQELRSKVSKSIAPKKRKLKEPKNRYEEDVQVAIAISSSLAAEQNLIGGISAADKGREAKRKKNKTALEDACLLTTLTDDDRQRRMEEKVSNIIQMVNDIKYTEDTASLHESSLKAGTQHEGCSLWERCSRDPDTCNNEVFYVGALVPP